MPSAMEVAGDAGTAGSCIGSPGGAGGAGGKQAATRADEKGVGAEAYVSQAHPGETEQWACLNSGLYQLKTARWAQSWPADSPPFTGLRPRGQTVETA